MKKTSNRKNITRILALKNLKMRPVRTGCMIFFTFVLAAVLFVSSILVDSMESSLKNTTDRLGADIIVVPKEYESEMADSLFLGNFCSFTFEKSWIEEIEKIEGIEAVTPQLYLTSLNAACCSVASQMVAYDPETDFIITAWLEDNHLEQPKRGEVILGDGLYAYAEETFFFFNEPYKVVGKLEKTNTSYDTCAFMTFETAQDIMNSAGWQAAFGTPKYSPLESVSSLMIRAKDGADLKDIARKINFSIEDSPLYAYTASGILNNASQSVESMSSYSTLLIGMLVVLVIIALLCIFTITINERTKEFGILTSLGTQSGKLAGMIVTEGLMIGAAGGLLGVLVSEVVLKIFANVIKQALGIPQLETGFGYVAATGIKCFLLSVAIALLATAYSAWRVSRSAVADLIKGEEI